MTLEEQYTKETGIDLYTMDGPHEILDMDKYFEYVGWLETKLDHYKRLAEAAEDVIMEQDGHCTSDLYYARFDIWENIKNERMEAHHE